MRELIRFKDVFVQRTESVLIMGNSVFTRKFDLSGTVPRTVSMTDGRGCEFASPEKGEMDFSFIGFPKADVTAWEETGLETEAFPPSLFDGEHVRVVMRFHEPVGDTFYGRTFRLYPGIPGMSVENSIRASVMPCMYWTHRNTITTPGEAPESVVDSVRPAAGFCPRRSVEFFGRTDDTDVRVAEHESSGPEFRGGILLCEDAAKNGFLYLQEAPPSSERRDFESWDFRTGGGTVFSCCWGIAPEDIRSSSTEYSSCRSVLLVYHGASERESVLKRYLSVRFPDRSGISITVNPWGSPDFRSRVSPEFLRAEFSSAVETGATRYQIDDGWQQGATYGTVPLDSRRISQDFWTMKPALASAFRRLVEEARSLGVEPGMWFAASPNCEYRDYAVLRSLIERYHTEYGIDIFKMDFVRLRTWESEHNLRFLMQELRESSNGRIRFDLDVTNGQRGGYFMFLEYGDIFLENRYCYAGIGYHPEKTLRSLWTLARWTRTQTLQIEIPSPADVDPGFYRERALSDPREYPLEYWAGISLFANPLLWFAPSTVPAEDRKRLAVVMSLYRKVRDGVFSGEIRPVGCEPDGRSITGFYSDSGYAVLFRERGEVSGRATVQIPGENWRPVYGSGRLSNGVVEIAVPASFVLFQADFS